MHTIISGLSLLLLAGLFQGSFAIFFRYTRPLLWESYWSIYAIIALFIGPVLFAFFIIPHFLLTLFSIPTTAVIFPVFFGVLWGIGGILFGRSLDRIGMSLTYTIILSMTTIVGTILPLILSRTAIPIMNLMFVVGGLLCIMIGIILSCYTGVLKEKNAFSVSKRKVIRSGIFLALISGLFLPMLSIGYLTGSTIASVALRAGATTLNAGALVWVIVLFAGFVVNIFYTAYLMGKNNSIVNFALMNMKNVSAAVLSGIFWFGGFVLYSMGPSKLGNFGASFGWEILISLSIIFSTLWGITFGEWKDAARPLRLHVIAVVVILIGVVFLGLSFMKTN